jgi:hypothetical protein
LTVAGCAIVYPLVGLIACERRFHFSVWGKLLANNALSLILLATIIIASLAMAQTLYWQVMHFAFPSLAHYAPAALSDFDVRFETLYQLQLVPVSFAFEVFPAVVVGLLIKGLGLSSE